MPAPHALLMRCAEGDHKQSEILMQATFRVRAMDKYLNLVKLPASDLDAAGPKGFQAMLLGPNKTEQASSVS